MGHNPWVPKELDTTEPLTHTHTPLLSLGPAEHRPVPLPLRGKCYPACLVPCLQQPLSCIYGPGFPHRSRGGWEGPGLESGHLCLAVTWEVP